VGTQAASTYAELKTCAECLATQSETLSRGYGCEWCSEELAALYYYRTQVANLKGVPTVAEITAWYTGGNTKVVGDATKSTIQTAWNGLTQCVRGKYVRELCMGHEKLTVYTADPQSTTGSSGSSGLSGGAIAGIVIAVVVVLGLVGGLVWWNWATIKDGLNVPWQQFKGGLTRKYFEKKDDETPTEATSWEQQIGGGTMPPPLPPTEATLWEQQIGGGTMPPPLPHRQYLVQTDSELKSTGDTGTTTAPLSANTDDPGDDSGGTDPESEADGNAGSRLVPIKFRTRDGFDVDPSLYNDDD